MKIFSRGITNTPNMPVHEKVVLALGYVTIGHALGMIARTYWNDHRETVRLKEAEDVAQAKAAEAAVRPWPEKKVSGVNVEDLKFKSFDPYEELNPSDYWHGDVLRGWGPSKPNPHAPDTFEHDDWARKQALTSF